MGRLGKFKNGLKIIKLDNKEPWFYQDENMNHVCKHKSVSLNLGGTRWSKAVLLEMFENYISRKKLVQIVYCEVNGMCVDQ